ncbi:hypothetical protein [Sediminicola arcticus]|jgi:hypothetical protein|uniref:Uncharacterized protein n=1 Tax=Sediminicola arcticus TaxID=1574308 RepID=A0ABV2SWJ1_9FLAO
MTIEDVYTTVRTLAEFRDLFEKSIKKAKLQDDKQMYSELHKYSALLGSYMEGLLEEGMFPTDREHL